MSLLLKLFKPFKTQSKNVLQKWSSSSQFQFTKNTILFKTNFIGSEYALLNFKVSNHNSWNIDKFFSTNFRSTQNFFDTKKLLKLLDQIKQSNTNNQINRFTNKNDLTDLVEFLLREKRIEDISIVLNIAQSLPLFDSIMLNKFISLSTRYKNFDFGKKVYKLVKSNSLFQNNIYIQSNLVNMFCRFYDLETAKLIFQNIPIKDRDIVTFSAMLNGLVYVNLNENALNLFYEMKKLGIKPNERTYLSIIQLCGKLNNLELLNQIYNEMKANNIEIDIQLQSSLLDNYFKCNDLETAKLIFQNIPIEDRDIVTFNTMLKGLIDNNLNEDALNLYEQMEDLGVEVRMKLEQKMEQIKKNQKNQK